MRKELPGDGPNYLGILSQNIPRWLCASSPMPPSDLTEGPTVRALGQLNQMAAVLDLPHPHGRPETAKHLKG